MRRKKVLGVLLRLVALLVVVGTAHAQKQPNLKSWSNQIPNANKRFVVLNDFGGNAVLDRETGLVWETTPGATNRAWGVALGACYGARTGGRGGWRLPKMEELTSLIDPSETFPPLPQGHPFDLSNITGDVWSATTVPIAGGTTANTQDVIGTGFLGGADMVTAMLESWCVRGGQGIDGQ